jgi:hypothetical protein
MSIQVLNATLGNGASNAVQLGQGGQLAVWIPPTDQACSIVLNATNQTGMVIFLEGSLDYASQTALGLTPTWAPLSGFNEGIASWQFTGTGGITLLDSQISSWQVPILKHQAVRVRQNGVIGGTGSPLVSIISAPQMTQINSLPPVSISTAAITDNSGGTASSTAGVVATASEGTVIIPAQLADFVNSGTWTIALPYGFTVLSALFRTGKPASTASKLTTLTLSTSAGAVTGGVMALTTANQNTTGGTVAATAISGANATAAAGGTIIVTPTSTTAFVEGDGWIEVTVKNNDLANAIATMIALENSIRAALLAA